MAGKKRASAHVFTSEDAENESDAKRARYTAYYCKFSGEHVLTTTADISALPRRRTDGALMLDLRAHPTRVLAETSATTIAVRGKDGTYEKRRRVTLGDVPVGYRDASGGGGSVLGEACPPALS